MWGSGKFDTEEVTLHDVGFEGARFRVFRADKGHPFISGNKAWKLKYNLQEAARRGCSRLVTFGGAYSNHLLAVAAAAHELGLESVGIVRGNEPMHNPILAKCKELGMRLQQVSREEYRDKEKISERYGLTEAQDYLLPEGGTNALAVKGCEEAVPSGRRFDHILVPAGTGGTIAGWALGASHKIPEAKVHGIVVLKGGGFLHQAIDSLVPGLSNWKLYLDYHHGGYAKTSVELEMFINRFSSTTGIPLEPTYSGKLFFAVMDMINRGEVDQKSNILAVHTGGIWA